MKYLLLLSLAIASQNALSQDSIYTSIDPKDCLTIISSDLTPNPEIDFYEAQCPSLGDYQVTVSGGDLRYDLSLKYQGEDIAPLSYIYSFHDMGSTKIEWRYSRNPRSHRAALRALIFRIDGSQFEGDVSVEKSYLHVVKLAGTQTCTVAVLDNTTNLNEAARKIADNIDDYSCVDSSNF